MRTTLLVFFTILLATCSFSFTEKEEAEECEVYYTSELVTYDGHSSCGRLFRPVGIWDQFYVTKSPQDFYPIAGRQYYITKVYFMTYGSCTMYEITSWSPGGYYY